MPRFKIGDRVRLNDDFASLNRYGVYKGQLGTVIGHKPFNEHLAYVLIDGVSSVTSGFAAEPERERGERGEWHMTEDSLELVVEPARYIYTGAMIGLAGKPCTIQRTHPTIAARVVVLFPHDGRERVVDMKNLTPEGAKPMKNFKTLVLNATEKLLASLDRDSVKEQAVRRLGVAAELVRIGEREKKAAKDSLTRLGVIGIGADDGVIFDSPGYVVTQTTKAASSRLDAKALDAAIDAEGLSGAMKRRIIAAATVPSAAPVSYSVESK